MAATSNLEKSFGIDMTVKKNTTPRTLSNFCVNIFRGNGFCYEVDQGHHVSFVIIWCVIQQYVYETIHDVDDLQKRLMQLGLTLTSDIIDHRSRIRYLSKKIREF